MPCVQTTNWSTSPARPAVGRSASRIPIAATMPATTNAMRAGVHSHARSGSGVICRSDPLGDPVALGEPVDPAERADLSPERANGVGHLSCPAEQPIELALVEPDAGDLALELVGDVRIFRGERDIS